MLSDEEKEAIEWIKRLVQLNKRDNLDDTFAEILLNLIEKQQKEIEDHIENKELINQTLGLEKNANINKTLEKIIILNNYQDKIKAEIEKLNRSCDAEEEPVRVIDIIEVLQELLDEKE